MTLVVTLGMKYRSLGRILRGISSWGYVSERFWNRVQSSFKIQLKYAIFFTCLATACVEFAWLLRSDHAPPRARSLLASQASHMKVDQNGLRLCGEAVTAALYGWNKRQLPYEERVFIVYHVGFLGPDDSFRMNADNVRMFLSSFRFNLRRNSTFLAVNVCGGAYNPLKRVVDEYIGNCENFCTLLWSANESDMLTHALTLASSELQIEEFRFIVALNNGVRGPLVNLNTWIWDFVSIISNEIVLVGPVLSCEKSPHVQTHMFCFSSSILDMFLQNELFSSTGEAWSETVERSEIGLSRSVMKAGLRIASLLHRRRWGETYFNGSCREELGYSNPTGWCEPYFRDSIFFKWGGEFYRQGLYCKRIRRIVEELSSTVTATYETSVY